LIENNERGGIVSLSLMTIHAWTQEYPEIIIDAVLTDRGMEALNNAVASSCLSAAYFLTQFYRPSDLIRPGALERLAIFVDANTPQSGPYAMPVMVVQGEADEAVPAEATERFVDGMCSAGADVTYRAYADTGHIEVIDAAEGDVLAWMMAVREGTAPPSTCG
jgi:alpha-beta hydrolase superfamily lysophospholipase